MLQVSGSSQSGTIKFPRLNVRRPAQSCSASKFGRACKAIWPEKTAEHLAAAADCAVRTAGYYLSGEREPSARAIAAIVNEIT